MPETSGRLRQQLLATGLANRDPSGGGTRRRQGQAESPLRRGNAQFQLTVLFFQGGGHRRGTVAGLAQLEHVQQPRFARRGSQFQAVRMNGIAFLSRVPRRLKSLTCRPQRFANEFLVSAGETQLAACDRRLASAAEQPSPRCLRRRQPEEIIHDVDTGFQEHDAPDEPRGLRSVAVGC